MAIARIEHLASLVRIFDDEDAVYGEPYQWSCTLRWISPDVIEAIGVDKLPSKAQLAALHEALHALGVSRVKYSRRREDGKLIEIVQTVEGRSAREVQQ